MKYAAALGFMIGMVGFSILMADTPIKKTGHRIGRLNDKPFVEKVAPKESCTPTPAPYYPY